MKKKEFGEKLFDLRKAKKASQSEVAEYIGLTVSAYQNYENGRREAGYETISKLANFYGVTTDYLLGHETKEEIPFLKLSKPFSDDKFIEIYSELPNYAKMMFLEVMGKLSKAIPESESDDTEEQSDSRKCIVRKAGDIMDELHSDEQANEKGATGS